jgi:hypothetical protein
MLYSMVVQNFLNIVFEFMTDKYFVNNTFIQEVQSIKII